MLQVISPLKGFSIEASDGRIGTVVDFLFDDESWKVRWLVIDCGTRLSGRRVLIHPSAILREDLEAEQFDVALTIAQVEGCPELGDDQPVSQQMEKRSTLTTVWTRSGASPISRRSWRHGFAPDGAAVYGPGFARRGRSSRRRRAVTGADPHLRSVVEVTGYRVHAVDGEIGHIEDLMLDGADWSVRYVIVDTRNWWFGSVC